MVSYEVFIGLIIIIVLIHVGSCNFSEIVMVQKHICFSIPLFHVFIMFYVSCWTELMELLLIYQEEKLNES